MFLRCDENLTNRKRRDYLWFSLTYIWIPRDAFQRRIVLLDFHRVSNSCSRTRETRSAPLFIGSGLDHENFRVNRPPIRYARVTRAKSSLLIRVSRSLVIHAMRRGGEEGRGREKESPSPSPFPRGLKNRSRVPLIYDAAEFAPLTGVISSAV